MIASFVFPSEKTRTSAHKLNGRSYAPLLNSIRDASPRERRDSAGLEPFPRFASRTHSSQPFAMSGQLASAVTGVRIFLSGLIGRDKYPPRTPTDRLEAFGSVVRLPLHVNQHGREVIHNHGQVVRRKHRA